MKTMSIAARPKTAPSGLIEISNEEFDAFRTLIFEEAGISLSPAKRALVCSRLAKRLRALGFSTFAEYYDHLLSEGAKSDERQQMINCITTNKTEFFRESHHFDFLKTRAFPEIKERARKTGNRRLRIWSAGCSTGEEPYTLAITLLEHFGPLSGWDVKILATDIDTQVLAKGQSGIYDLDSLATVPESLRSRYFLRGSGMHAGMCRVRPELQELITFRRINLMDERWPFSGPFDLIFCRNVLIYFNRETQERLVERYASQLTKDGYLFLGHSENIAWTTNLLAPLGGTIHKLRGEGRAKSAELRPAVASPAVPRMSAASRLSAQSVPLVPQLPKRNIVVGELFATKEPTELTTILGSCVAVCLLDPVAGVGGMNHILLPEGNETDDSTRYGRQAMESLINRIVELGGDRSRLIAKAFGGAHLPELNASRDVGAANIAFVRSSLAESGIPLQAERLGGNEALRVQFFTQSGRVRVEVLGQLARDKVAKSEAIHARRILDPR